MQLMSPQCDGAQARGTAQGGAVRLSFVVATVILGISAQGGADHRIDFEVPAAP